MVKGEASIRIQRPVETVDDFVVNGFFANYPRWSPEVTELHPVTSPPLRVGSQARQVRIDQGRKTRSRFRVTALERCDHVVFESDDEPGFRVTYRFRRVDGAAEQATQLEFVFELKRLEGFMRPFEKLIRLSVEDGAQQVARRIKKLIESET